MRSDMRPRLEAGLTVDGLQVSCNTSHAFRTAHWAGKEYTRRHPAKFMLFKRCLPTCNGEAAYGSTTGGELSVLAAFISSSNLR